jgi:hypothetical protein
MVRVEAFEPNKKYAFRYGLYIESLRRLGHTPGDWYRSIKDGAIVEPISNFLGKVEGDSPGGKKDYNIATDWCEEVTDCVSNDVADTAQEDGR